MIHYHGTPITPMTALYELAGRHFCVSHARPDDVARVHAIGQSVMLDNGAFSKWKRGADTDWPAFYAWRDRWLGYPTTWAVIPDVIDGGSQLQDALLREWPFGHRGAPVWHMDEPLSRLHHASGRVHHGAQKSGRDRALHARGQPAHHRRRGDTQDCIPEAQGRRAGRLIGLEPRQKA